MDRRGFLSGILALGAAPAIVRAASLMPVRGYKLSDAGLYEPLIDLVEARFNEANMAMKAHFDSAFMTLMDEALTASREMTVITPNHWGWISSSRT